MLAAITILLICFAIVLLLVLLKMAGFLYCIQQELGTFHCKDAIPVANEKSQTDCHFDSPLEWLNGICCSIAFDYSLSKREKEILAYFARGKSNAAIAEELCIGESTVKTHSYNIYQKLNVHNRDDLITLVENRLLNC
jgi:DNA-binding NarL/FixJ family response regulator